MIILGTETINIWLIVLFVIFLFEAFTGGHVFMIYLFIPCIVTWLTTMLTDITYDLQIFIFIVLSAISILVTRKILKKELYKENQEIDYTEEVNKILKSEENENEIL